MLARQVDDVSPRLLILDPFVRLHRIDENVSGDVAPLLAFLRELQRRHAIAVAVVHHAKKGAAAIRAGQALRGSSEFHACQVITAMSRLTVRDGLLMSVAAAEAREAATTDP
jgi:RecA-family ATPase